MSPLFLDNLPATLKQHRIQSLNKAYRHFGTTLADHIEQNYVPSAISPLVKDAFNGIVSELRSASEDYIHVDYVKQHLNDYFYDLSHVAQSTSDKVATERIGKLLLQFDTVVQQHVPAECAWDVY